MPRTPLGEPGRPRVPAAGPGPNCKLPPTVLRRRQRRARPRLTRPRRRWAARQAPGGGTASAAAKSRPPHWQWHWPHSDRWRKRKRKSLRLSSFGVRGIVLTDTAAEHSRAPRRCCNELRRKSPPAARSHYSQPLGDQAVLPRRSLIRELN